MQIGASSDNVWELWNEIYDRVESPDELYNNVWGLLLKYGYIDMNTDNVEIFFNSLDKNTLTNLYFDLKKIQDEYNGRK